MLRDLGRALSDAIAESSEVDQALRRLQEEGYSLFIFLERQGGRGSARSGTGKDATDGAWEPPAGVHGEPVFRIHGGDLSFLRSIGIDPTRRIRTRKPR